MHKLSPIACFIITCLGCISCTSTKELTDVVPKKIEDLDGCRIERYAFPSKVFGDLMRVAIVLPPGYEDTDRDYPVLYALHGYGAPYGTYASMSPLRKALKDKPMIVACFDGGGQYYIDSPVQKKSKYTTFFFDEFIPYVDAHYRVDVSKRAITGFSMGGHGALHYTLTNPEMFVSTSSMSGTFPHLSRPTEKQMERFERLLGKFEDYPQNYRRYDPYLRLAKAEERGVKMPPLFLHCGDEDFLLEENHSLRDFLKEKGFQVTYLETPGAHNWTFWKAGSKGIIDFHWRYFGEK